MATLIGLPKLSPTMEEGVLAKWSKKEGDRVLPGDVIAEVETDKANMDFTLEDEGVLLKLLVRAGDTVKLGAPVAILGEAGEDVAALLEKAKAGAIPANGRALAAEPAPPSGSAPGPAAPAPAPIAPGGRVLASPLAKTLAAEHGIDLRTVRGTGPGGRIVERDLLALMQGAAPPPAPSAPIGAVAPSPALPPTPLRVPPGDDVTDRPVSMMRKTIARRLTEAKATVPHFYLTSDCDAGPLLSFRAQINEIAGADARISVNDLLIKAVALALRRVPSANASFLGDVMRMHGRVHIGVAVAIDDGLVTPVVRDADKKGLAAINAEVKDFAARAKNKRIMPEEMTGGTFTISNLGMYGIDHFEAILNPPEGAILAVGATKKVPVVIEDPSGDRLAIGQRMALTLSCDHRVIDGAVGATFLKELVRILEHPQALAM
jgi:pyruvate dehydrogenase E2 component (dihydrolipoamide acetyltransferase)